MMSKFLTIEVIYSTSLINNSQIKHGYDVYI